LLVGDQWKLGDFGITIRVDEPRLTQTGRLRLNPVYAGPECHAGGEATAESDVYSFGVMALATWLGRDPSKLERDKGPAHDDPLRPVIRKCLQRQPTKRFRTASELLVTLRAESPER
jgi:eukaryotic-like serine/threonine-protein kinase